VLTAAIAGGGSTLASLIAIGSLMAYAASSAPASKGG
jgi:hypothetical protein